MKPVYPEILTPDNTLAITNNGDGTVTINPNQEFLIQDVKLNTSRWPAAQRTFTVSPSTTYHLRFSLNGRPINNYTPQKLSFYLVNVNDANSNPNSVDEADPQFDTQYDDMLIAKISADANGNITITSLKNKKHIISFLVFRGVPHRVLTTFTYNISRKPSFSIQSYSHTQGISWGVWNDDGEIRIWKSSSESGGVSASTAWIPSTFGLRIKGNRYSGSILFSLPEEGAVTGDNYCDIKLIMEA